MGSIASDYTDATPTSRLRRAMMAGIGALPSAGHDSSARAVLSVVLGIGATRRETSWRIFARLLQRVRGVLHATTRGYIILFSVLSHRQGRRRPPKHARQRVGKSLLARCRFFLSFTSLAGKYRKLVFDSPPPPMTTPPAPHIFSREA